MPAAVLEKTTHQRSHGAAEVVLGGAPGAIRIGRLSQAGSAKAILPKVHGADPEVVFLNTSGGLTGEDRLRYSLETGAGLRATATTQTAERAYRSGGGSAEVMVRHRVGAGGWLDWLPQETILFDGADLSRRTEIELGQGAGCLMLEAVVLGRHAMGETVRNLGLRDHRVILREGRPVHIEPLMLSGAMLTGSRAVLGEARAFASLVLVAPDAADRLAPLRRVLDEPGAEAGASAFDGRLTLRILARDGLPMRRQIIRALTTIRARPLPRVWQN